MDYQVFTLNNGIKVIHKQIEGIVAHCGFFINVGTRDELDHEQGMAHYIEHVIFKGTKKRKAYHILSRLDDVGGDLNAYTSKEETCIYATFLTEHYQRSIELLSDITFNSTFPQKEIEKEKEVIIDEINSYKDNPSDLIFDDFEEIMFKEHPLGKNILGTKKHIKKYTQKDILKFVERTYTSDSIIFCSLGNISFKEIQKLCNKYIGDFPIKSGISERKQEIIYNPFFKSQKKSNYQSHCVIGAPAYDMSDERKTALTVLNNILGGPSMNTRLNLNIREKYGFCYNIESNYSPYLDTGVFSVYLGTDKAVLEKSIALVYKELKKLKDNKLSSLQLHKAKKQIIGQIAISQQNNSTEMLSLGKSLLLFNKVDTLEEIYNKINNITAEEMLEISNEIFDKDKLSTLIYTP